VLGLRRGRPDRDPAPLIYDRAVRLTVLGSCGAWPEAGQACSGFLLEHDGFCLVIDLGYATFPRLLQRVEAARVDAVFISHGHPDHCADLNPLLRARALGDNPSPPLPVYAPPGALDAVLALDRPGLLDRAIARHAVTPGAKLEIGPFTAQTRLLPHWLPNAGVRLRAGDRVLTYTGDAGPSDDLVDLARDADLLLADATYVEEAPPSEREFIGSARGAGRQAGLAAARRLLLTHLWPGTPPADAVAAARSAFDGAVEVAAADLVVDLGPGTA
jgi:ribonuclease BN (tRNA processing enzyme)